jgi:Domain of unknown function (DUF5615)
VKLLLDEQISGKVAERLRKRDVVATTDEPALRGLGDPDLFEVAQAQERAVVTYNRPDFEAIVREYAESGREHHGLVIVHPTRFPGSDFGRLAAALAGFLEAPPPGKSFLVWLQEP